MHCGWKYKHCAAAIKNRMAGSTLLAPPPALPAAIQRAIGGVSLLWPTAGAWRGGAQTFPDPIDSQVTLQCWLHSAKISRLPSQLPPSRGPSGGLPSREPDLVTEDPIESI